MPTPCNSNSHNHELGSDLRNWFLHGSQCAEQGDLRQALCAVSVITAILSQRLSLVRSSASSRPAPSRRRTNLFRLISASSALTVIVVALACSSQITTSSNVTGDISPPPVCDPVEDPDVRTQGFWKRQCQGPHPSGEHDNLPDYVDFVDDFATFADEVVDVDDLCDRLHPNPENDKCEQAEAQFTALLLNLASGRIAVCNCIDDPDLGQTTVGDAAEFIDGLLSNPGRTFEDCVLAQAIADRINSGLTLVACP